MFKVKIQDQVVRTASPGGETSTGATSRKAYVFMLTDEDHMRFDMLR